MTRHLMTSLLSEALDSMTAQQRQILAVIADESEHDWFRALLLGLRCESIAAQCRQDANLAAHEADHRAEVDALAEAATWHTEPEDRTKGEAYWPETDSGA